MMIGMVTSAEALISIAFIALVANAVLNWRLPALWRGFLRHPALLGITGIFAVYALSGLYSEDTAYFFRRLRSSLPLFLLPFAISALPRFGRRVYYSLLYFFFWLLLLTCTLVALNYAADYDAINQLYKKGQVMPTPMRHIRFSLTVALAVAVGFYLAGRRFYWRWPAERYALIGGSLLLTLFLHILAVRSGLLALYLMAGYAFLRFILIKGYWVGGLLGLVLGAAALYLAIEQLPTLQNKLNYTHYTLHQFLKGGAIEELSDSQRIGSIQAGIEMARQHPWLGVGLGDVRQEAEAYYRSHFPGLAGRQLLPHNQYVFVLAATGIPGLLYFIGATLYPLLYRRGYRDGLWSAFHLMIFASFMVEHTLETQFGLTLYLLFLLMGIRYLDEPAPAKEGPQ
mgnify:FL=1